MPATTEVAVIVLKPGTDIEAEPTAGIIRELGETLQQQDGYQQMHTGIWIENPQSMQFFISESPPPHYSLPVHDNIKNPVCSRK